LYKVYLCAKPFKMKRFKEWVRANPYKTVVTILAVILLLLLLQQCKENSRAAEIYKKKEAVAEQNIAALNDSLRKTKTKEGQPEFDKLSLLVQDVKDLKKLNEDLANEVKITKGKVASIAKISAKVVHDTTYLEASSVADEETVVTTFNKDTTYSEGNSRSIAGYTEYDVQTGQSFAAITKDEINIAFVTGIKNLDKGKPEIFIRSDYPGFSPTSISGAVLNPKLFSPKTKQKLLTFGLNIGYVPITYSIIDKKLDFNSTRFGASIGANINFSRLLKLNKP